MLFISFSLFLAFRDLSSLRTHFRPFTEVVRRIRLEVTREIGRQMNRGLRRRHELEKSKQPDVTGWIERQASAAADSPTVRSIQRIVVTAMQAVENGSIVLAINRIDQAQ